MKKYLLLIISIACLGINANAQGRISVSTMGCGGRIAFGSSYSHGCVPSCITFTDSSINLIGLNNGWLWEFGDGTTSNVENPPKHCFTKAGSYIVTLVVYNTTGCVDSVKDTFNLYVPPIGFAISPNPDTNNVPVTFSDTAKDTNVVYWSWNFGDGVKGITGKNPTHQYAADGKYDVCLLVNDLNGCKNTICDSVVIGPVLTGIKNVSATVNDISLYPNPVTGRLTLSFNKPTKPEIEIYDITGKVLLSEKTDDFSSIVPIDITSLTAGMYFVKITTEKSERVLKFVKE